MAALLLCASSALAQGAPPPQGAAPPPGAQAQPIPYAAAPYGAPAPYGQPPPGVYYAPPSAPSPGYPTGPRIMDYEEGQPIPEGYHVETRARRGLIIGGAVTFGVTYLLSVLVGLSAETADVASGGTGESFTPLYIPLAGPFVTIGTAEAKGGGIFVLMLDGVAQVAGATMLIGGLASPATKLVRNDFGLSVKPIVTGNTLGFGLSGTL